MTAYRVATIMRPSGPTLTPDVPIRRAVALLVEHGAAAAPVVEAEAQLIGILTQKDCFRPCLNAAYYSEWRGTVADHMSGDPVTIDAQADVMTAAELFLSIPHRVVPVLSGTRLAGMLDRSDVLRFLVRTG